MRKLTTLTALLSSLTSLVILVYLLVGVNISGAVTIDTHSICRTIAPEGSKLICVEQTSEFLDTEEVAYILIKLFEVTTADKISYKIFDPNSAVVAESSKVSDGNYPESYEIISLEIAGQNRPAGAYTFKFYLNDQEALSGTFTITQDTSTCEAQDFYCCPDSKICISASEGVCGSGKCCENEENCKSLTSVLFTRREVPSCEEEGLNGCEDAVLVYDYTLHGEITPEQKI
ncbi:hypothetical protein FJZ53_07315, partial [Candidatus Woesearchaeota archaeon]|nr:hypothetical protein [Candidatus Woesearchaeota archaeon]